MVRRGNPGQSAIEAAVLVFVAASALAVFFGFIRAAVSDRMKIGADSFGHELLYGKGGCACSASVSAAYAGTGNCAATCNLGTCTSMVGVCYSCEGFGSGKTPDEATAKAKANAVASSCNTIQRNKGYPFCGFCTVNVSCSGCS